LIQDGVLAGGMNGEMLCKQTNWYII
jgi:hypothetical protein